MRKSKRISPTNCFSSGSSRFHHVCTRIDFHGVCLHACDLPASAYQRVLQIVETSKTKRLQRTARQLYPSQCGPEKRATASSACSRKALAQIRADAAEKPAKARHEREIGPWRTECQGLQNETKELKKRRVATVGPCTRELMREAANCLLVHGSDTERGRSRKGTEVDYERVEATGGEEQPGAGTCKPRRSDSKQDVVVPSHSIMRKRARTEKPEDERLHEKAGFRVCRISSEDAAAENTQNDEFVDSREVASRQVSADPCPPLSSVSKETEDHQAEDYGEREEKEPGTDSAPESRDTGLNCGSEDGVRAEQREEEQVGGEFPEVAQHRVTVKKGGEPSEEKAHAAEPPCCPPAMSAAPKAFGSSASSSRPLFHPSPSLLQDNWSDASARESPVSSPCGSGGTCVSENRQRPLSLQPPSALLAFNLCWSPAFFEPASPSPPPSPSVSSFPLSAFPLPSPVSSPHFSSSTSPAPPLSLASSPGILPCQCTTTNSPPRLCQPLFHCHSPSPFCAASNLHPNSAASSSSSSLLQSFSVLLSASRPAIKTPSLWQSILRLCRLNSSETGIPLESTIREVAETTASLAMKEIEKNVFTQTRERFVPNNYPRRKRIGGACCVSNQVLSKVIPAAAAPFPTESAACPAANQGPRTPTEGEKKRIAQNVMGRNKTPTYDTELERQECIGEERVMKADVICSTLSPNRTRRRYLDYPSEEDSPHGRGAGQPGEGFWEQGSEVKEDAYSLREIERSLWRTNIETAVSSMLETTRCKSVRKEPE